MTFLSISVAKGEIIKMRNSFWIEICSCFHVRHYINMASPVSTILFVPSLRFDLLGFGWING